MPDYSAAAPDNYNELLELHRYIKEADQFILALLASLGLTDLLEIGCGKGRFTRKLARLGLEMTAVDPDAPAIGDAQTLLQGLGLHNVHLLPMDIADYRHPHKLRAIVSKGVHHHIPKAHVPAYLASVRDMLTDDGVFIVGDEFLAPYKDEASRQVVAAMWYAHIIASALEESHNTLARVEARTLLDDLARGEENPKREPQISLILRTVGKINQPVVRGQKRQARRLASQLLQELRALAPSGPTGVAELDTSLGDFKIDGARFRREVARAGLFVKRAEWWGPLDMCGAMGVFVLGKAQR